MPYKKLRGKLTKPKYYKSHRIDWIISDLDKGNLLCLTIDYTGNGWKLKEYVNFFGLTPRNMKKMIDMGYATMIDAARKFDKYTRKAGHHTFPGEKILLSNYWKGLDLPSLKGKHSVNISIDKEEFLREVSHLFPESNETFIKRYS